MSTPRPNPFSQPKPWDDVAQGYAEEAYRVMRPHSERAIELGRLGHDGPVVDVATGPGTLAVLVARRGVAVHALDFSELMLEQLRLRAEQEGLTNVLTTLGDGQALPYADATFQAGFSMFGLMFFPDRARGFAELFRVLRPGARAVVSSWAPVAESSLMRLMFGALKAADPSRADPVYDPTSLENPELFSRLLSDAGFVDVEIVRSEAQLELGSTADFWAALVRSSAPLVMLRKSLGEDEWRRQAAHALAYIERERGTATHLGTKAFLGVGTKPT